MGHPALLQVLDKETAGQPFPRPQPSRDCPATGATPVPGIPFWEALWQCRTVQMLLFLFLFLLGVGGDRILAPAQRAQPGHRPPAHLQMPSAKCCSQLKFLLCSSSVPLPDNSSYFIPCLCNQLCRSGRNWLLSSFLAQPPLAPSSDAILPPIAVCCCPCHSNEIRNKNFWDSRNAAKVTKIWGRWEKEKRKRGKGCST